MTDVHEPVRPRAPVVDFDHLAHASLGGSQAAWDALRAEHPVAWSDAHDGYWILSGYDVVTDAFRDWETFSSARADPKYSSLTIGKDRMPLLIPEELDPPEWKEPRSVLARLLSPRAVEELQPRVRHWVDHHLDAIIERGHGDLAADLAVPVPSAVTMEWLGWPEDEWHRAAATFHQMARHPYGSPEFLAAGQQFGWLAQRIWEEVAERRRAPRDDVLTVIAEHADPDPDRPWGAAEAMVLLTIGGGVDTTTSLTSAALVHLGRDTELRARLRDDRSLIPFATEEFLRMYTPARTHARTLTRDVEVGGCPMRAGDRVLLSEAAACRDPRQFPDADTFVADRTPNRHVAFGVGIHRCPGSHLARLEFTEMLHAVLDRMPHYELGEVAEYPNWGQIGGWADIAVTVGPTP